MGLSLKSVGTGLKKAFKGVKKAASVANPLFGAGYDALGGKGAKTIGKNYVQNNLDGAKVAAIGAAGQAALPLVTGASGATSAAGAAGAASKMGTLGKILGSPLAPAALEFGGSLISGIGQGRQAADDRRESGRQFDLEYGLKKREADAEEQERQRKLAAGASMAPMRGELMRMLAQRLGANVPMGGAQPMPTPTPSLPQPPMAPGAATHPAAGGDGMMRAILERLRGQF